MPHIVQLVALVATALLEVLYHVFWLSTIEVSLRLHVGIVLLEYFRRLQLIPSRSLVTVLFDLWRVRLEVKVVVCHRLGMLDVCVAT